MFVVVFANGEFVPPPDLQARLEAAELIIAADGGASHLETLGRVPNVLVGDFDSLSTETANHLKRKGVRVDKYPAAKEQTDLELALDHALRAGASEIAVLAGLGQRWDHSLANLLLAAHPKYAGVQIQLVQGEQRVHTLRGANELKAKKGERVSLIPISSDALGVSTRNLLFPLNHETLYFGSSRGVSNIVVGDGAEVSIESGVLLCIISPEDNGGSE
ncbi:MAG: thiamine diphosphokinase [Anaerolineales bacterium]